MKVLSAWYGKINSRENKIRIALKTVYLWIFVYVFSPIRNVGRAIFGNCHTTVLLYHRVSEEHVDSITVTPTQFRRQLDILKRGYTVISMDNFLQSRNKPRRRPAVVVTFDDGYNDNYLAASILHKANIPCAFFICTGIVGTVRSFPRDIRLKRNIDPLNWDQVHKIAAWGFDIANHTATHPNLGKIPTEDALSEIQTAAHDLVQKLGDKCRISWFAYPFGGKNDITADILKQLNGIGVMYCFSAYGGVNFPAFDQYNILRQGIGHKINDLTFRAIIEGHQIRH
ncbi:Polysaccharide deacetylase [Nitrosomonas marina]|uniref:Polysaccharide deacetylase n=1 Tax=Nitrosomonas marina TaxID=917 RepID=A0A1I0G5K9_9PROT|nr:polysaccharide deacetylase family protein [Nitrosomonas marina]SET66124.1 Polysaccharide deacetylase [Nitrosomonas marina]